MVMLGQHEVKTLERILNMDWRTTDNSRHHSQVALFNEFLRRTGLWCVMLQWEEAHPIVSDIPGRIFSGLKAKPVNTVLLQQSLRTLGRTSVYERMLLTRVLNWAALDDMGMLDSYKLPDIYEPLLLFYERGGWLDKAPRTGEWEISGVYGEIDRAFAYSDVDPISLDDASLNAMDTAKQS